MAKERPAILQWPQRGCSRQMQMDLALLPASSRLWDRTGPFNRPPPHQETRQRLMHAQSSACQRKRPVPLSNKRGSKTTEFLLCKKHRRQGRVGFFITLHYGCESWCLTANLVVTLPSWNHGQLREMCCITINQVCIRRIIINKLYERTGVQSIEYPFRVRTLRWVGHVAHMDKTRLPHQLLTAWVANSRPIGDTQRLPTAVL
jgi:hypothetical protein